MAEGKSHDRWGHTASLIASMFNIRYHLTGSDTVSPAKFMPFDDDEKPASNGRFRGWTDQDIRDFESLKE